MAPEIIDKQLAANRRNATRSTGPRTPEGKARVKWNALKHGLLARSVVVPLKGGPENRRQFKALLEQGSREGLGETCHTILPVSTPNCTPPNRWVYMR